MTSLKTAQEKAREAMGVQGRLGETEFFIDPRGLDILVATIYTDLLDSIEERGKKVAYGVDLQNRTYIDVADFLSVIKEHRV